MPSPESEEKGKVAVTSKPSLAFFSASLKPPCFPRSHALSRFDQIELEPSPSPISSRRDVDDLGFDASTPTPACSTF
jgi:hypothetical protein